MEAAIAGGATAPALIAGKGICQYVCHQINYLKNIHGNFKKLEKEVEALDNRRDDVIMIISRDIARKMPTNECKAWLKKVEDTKTEVSSLKTKYNEARKRQCGWCHYLSLSKKLERMSNGVGNLRDEGKLENGIVTERPPQPVEMKNPQKSKDIPSLNDVLQKTLDYLRDDNIKIIGIWGMEGVGKTTIMKNLNDAQDIATMFDITIWVTVPKESTIKDLQQEVLRRLTLHVDSSWSIYQVAPIISKALERKKYLLLLDNVFSKFDLHDVGIHDNHKYGKVVLAARCRNVVRDMGTHEEIFVQRLSKDDAWKMFREKVGQQVVDHPNIKPLARQVVKECGDLPQMIEIVASYLRKNNNEGTWRHTLRQLKSPSSTQTQNMEDLYKPFKHVYDELQENKKKCLLYGALYPADHEVHTGYLLECWSAEGFIHDVENLREARETGNAMLEDLINWCFLERIENRLGYVKMPLLFRRLALRFTSPNEEDIRILVKGQETQQPPVEDEWKQAKRISLIGTQLCTLPERPSCCMISTLLLQRNSRLMTIPDTFFGYMCNLRVLDFYGTRIGSLPVSLASLFNLKALYLNDCKHLEELPTEIVELKSLEVLDVCDSGICVLPREIGELTALRCLRVSFASVGYHNHIQETRRLMIPQNVISRLSLLEELSIHVDPLDQRWDKNVDVVVEEMASLEQLKTLHFYFSRMDSFKCFIGSSKSWNHDSTSFEKYRSFKFLVGSHGAHCSHGLKGMEHSMRHLIFSSGEDAPDVILQVLDHAGAFELIGHQNVEKLSDFGTERMDRLEFCLIEECNKMYSIIDGNVTADNALQLLEKLHIFRLPNLERIWEGSIRSGCLANLKTLILNECPKLKKIFSWDMIQLLSNLQELKVENCYEIEEIIIEAENEQIGNALQKLKTLELLNLPKLVKICQDLSLYWPSLERIEILGCMKLKSIPFTKDNTKKLRLIKCKEDWWEILVWQGDTGKERLEELLHFI